MNTSTVSRPGLRRALRATRALCAALLAALCLALTAPAAHAQVNPTEAQTFLEQKQAAVARLLSQRASARRTRALNEVLNGLLDYQELSRRALRNHWEGLSAEQREQFSTTLEALVRRQYESSLQRTANYAVTYDGADARRDEVTVRTMARSQSNRREPPVSIDYRMHQVNGEWRVFDVLTDGVSMVENYRAQFDRIIERDGFDALMTRMRERLDG